MQQLSASAQARRRSLGRKAAQIAKELEEISVFRLGTQVETDMDYLTDKEREAVEKTCKNLLVVSSGLHKLGNKLDK